MWVASKYGWFSIVQKDGGWHVRARVEHDLHLLLRAAGLPDEIQTWPDADYRYRVIIEDPNELADLLQALVESIDYPNFKSEIARSKTQAGKLHAYHDIWTIMAGQQR